MLAAAAFTVDFLHRVEHDNLSQCSGGRHCVHLSILYLLSLPLDTGPVLDDIDLGVGGLAVLNAGNDALLPDFVLSSNFTLLVEEEDDIAAHG